MKLSSSKSCERHPVQFTQIPRASNLIKPFPGHIRPTSILRPQFTVLAKKSNSEAPPEENSKSKQAEWEEALTWGFPSDKIAGDDDPFPDAEDEEELVIEDDTDDSEVDDDVEDEDEDEYEFDPDVDGEEDEGEKLVDIDEVKPGFKVFKRADLEMEKKLASSSSFRLEPISEEEARALDPSLFTDSDASAAAQAAAAQKALTKSEDHKLARDRKGYQAFEVDGGELLLGTNKDGALNLRDAYHFDGTEYSTPSTSGTMPRSAQFYQVIPWIDEYTGDIVRQKEPWMKVKKLFFIAVDTSKEIYELKLSSVFSYDVSTRILAKETVKTAKDVADPVLRIRPDGIFIEDSSTAPDPAYVAMFDDSGARDDLTEVDMEEIMSELDKEDFLDDLDEAPDVPAVDMM